MSEETKQIKHFLVPEHIKISDEEKQKLLANHNLISKQLPMIPISDPALVTMSVKIGDIILIKRRSHITREASYYRVVVDG
ncbi:MAG TPA: DNA-directed RNA polymerase subunit RpoH/Rpb5 C-terminal domain-containing protein [Candidatus Nanoarchaeia archaeon]|nr:DNA-directed RNA polymerase subunit RpoH/Rpb5 C-terminal domain-containing protein [Candidatus Nanoarchaeia archaeon]